MKRTRSSRSTLTGAALAALCAASVAACSWQETERPELGFKVLMPSEPTTESQTVETSKGSVILQKTCAFPGKGEGPGGLFNEALRKARGLPVACCVSTLEWPQKPKGPEQCKQVLDEVIETIAAAAEGRVTKTYSRQPHGECQRDVAVEGSAFGAVFARVRAVLRGHRVYVASVTASEREELDSAATERFLGSLHVD